VSLILLFGFLQILLSFALPTTSSGLGAVTTVLSGWLICAVKLIAEIDKSPVLIGDIGPAPAILYYCLIGFTGFVYLKRPLMKKTICISMLLAMIALLAAAKWQNAHRDSLTLTCLDVGHGQAILARLPGRANVLFDAGSMYKSDIGRRIVTPFLDFAGASKIDAIMISHNDVDHINGIPEIVEHCDVNGVYAADPNDTAAFLDNVLRKREKGFEINNIKDLNLNSAAKIKILWPNEQICHDQAVSDNDKSVVSLIEFAGRRILLCSDIERFAQKELLRLNPNLKADVDVAPHHGLVKTLNLDFLEKLGADILICSCDRNQYERMLQSAASQPASRREKTPKTFYTAAHGAIAITIEKDGTVRVTTFVGAADTQNQQK
jgi:competence protein ComEC